VRHGARYETARDGKLPDSHNSMGLLLVAGITMCLQPLLPAVTLTTPMGSVSVPLLLCAGSFDKPVVAPISRDTPQCDLKSSAAPPDWLAG